MKPLTLLLSICTALCAPFCTAADTPTPCTPVALQCEHLRNLYVTYDVTPQLQPGDNTIGVLLGNGWYNHQSLAVWDFHRAPWRNRPAFLLNLRITYTDGTTETLATGPDWKTSSAGPLVYNSIYTGEHYDARLEQPGWDTPHFNYKGFRYVEVTADRPIHLDRESLTAYFIHSDVPPIGHIDASDSLIPQLCRATNRAYLSNLMGYPTDCPQREKNGWTGTYADGVQTELSVPLYWGIVPDSLRRTVARNLARQVQEAGYHLDVGVLGAKAILSALSENGEAETAYRLATQTTYPSWGNWVVNGATTLLENWDLHATRDISDNHMMFGDIGGWFFKGLGGILPDPEQPGFKHIILRPNFPQGLERFEATHLSPYGEIRSQWERQGKHITYRVTVPPNSTATFYPPVQVKDRTPLPLEAGTYEWQLEYAE